METIFAVLYYAAGLNDLLDWLVSNWITPLYFGLVIIFSIMFIKNQSWRKLAGFVGFAAVVGVLIFAGPTFFGPNGSAVDVATEVGNTTFNGN